jgi:ATP-dependent Clp protease protease subunit
MGMAASMGQFLLCAGCGRQAVRSAERSDHDAPALAGLQGQATDIAIQAEQMAYIKKLLAEQIAAPHRSVGRADQKDSERDRWFTAEAAKDYGIIDIVRRGEMR